MKQKCKNKSQKFPSLKGNPNIWMFVQQITREISNMKTKRQNSNLSDTQIKTLQNLENNDTLVIKPSDKGGNIVLMNKMN